MKIINSIRSKGLQHSLFKSVLDEVDAEYGDLLLHAEVRWLSRCKVLQRVVELLPEIRSFLEARNLSLDKAYVQLTVIKLLNGL